MRKSYIQINGELIDKEDHEAIAKARGYAPVKGLPTVHGDLPDFVSPIDGKVYSGRAGLREHCLRHDVIPNADLKGLPPLTMTSDRRSESQKRYDRTARKEQIINLVNNHYR